MSFFDPNLIILSRIEQLKKERRILKIKSLFFKGHGKRIAEIEAEIAELWKKFVPTVLS